MSDGVAKRWIDTTEQDKQSVNHLLDDGVKIDVFRSQTTDVANAGFDNELSKLHIINTILGRIDPLGEDYVGLTDYLDCQINDVWRLMNVRDEQLNYRVTDVIPRVGGCQVMLKIYSKWAR